MQLKKPVNLISKLKCNTRKRKEYNIKEKRQKSLNQIKNSLLTYEGQGYCLDSFCLSLVLFAHSPLTMLD